jgi:DNA-binding response OmpR family regulator
MDVFITKLRKKLQDDPAIQLLNVRGFGFKPVC